MGSPTPHTNREIRMADIYYKKPNGEIFKYMQGKMVKASCDKKFVLCNADGKEIKEVIKKSKKKKGAK